MIFYSAILGLSLKGFSRFTPYSNETVWWVFNVCSLENLIEKFLEYSTRCFFSNASGHGHFIEFDKLENKFIFESKVSRSKDDINQPIIDTNF